MGVRTLWMEWSYWCSRFKLALERAGVQFNFPHCEQSHKQLCQPYHSRDGSLGHYLQNLSTALLYVHSEDSHCE